MAKTEKNLIHIKLTLTEAILGSAPADPHIYTTYIASKAPKEKNTDDEILGFEEEDEDKKGVTVFNRISESEINGTYDPQNPPANEPNYPCVMDYQIKGFFKNACSAMREVPKSESSKIKAYKKKIDNLIFIEQRKIKLENASDITIFERSLRAETPQGPRNTLAASEKIEAGATLTFDITILNPDLYPVVLEWLSYGKYNGLGQWHNGSMGRFVYEEFDDEGNLVSSNKSQA